MTYLTAVGTSDYKASNTSMVSKNELERSSLGPIICTTEASACRE